MRFCLAIVLALICRFLEASPVTWPTASSRVGQNIYDACDSDLYIAEFLHPEHNYRCISTGARMFSGDPVGIGGGVTPGVESMAMCSDQALIICLCGTGLGHCPSDYRVARYYVCSNPFEYPDSEPVEEVYDGAYAAFITSPSPHDCSKPSPETKVDPNHGDSYGDTNTGTGSGSGSSSGSGGGNSGGDTGGDTGGSEGDSSGGGSGDSGDSPVDPADYDCAEEIVPGDWSQAYSACSTSMANIYGSTGTYTFSSGTEYFDGTGASYSCDKYPADNYPTDCHSGRYEGCGCGSLDGGSTYWGYCGSYSGCWAGGTPGTTVSCYKNVSGPFYAAQHKKCSLDIPAPDGSNWHDEFPIAGNDSCSEKCNLSRDKYSKQYPPSSSGDGPENPEDYLDCVTTDGCTWVGTPMGYGVCHCSSDDSPKGDEGTGPTSRDGRSSGNSNGVSVGVCGKGKDGTSCEDTQQQVLSAVSELGENFENFANNFNQLPSQTSSKFNDDVNALNSQFQTDLNSDTFSSQIFQDANFQTWKQKLADQIEQIRTESTELTESLIPTPPTAASGDYGCLEFNFLSSHFGPICLSTYLEPVIPQVNAFLQFLKYFVGFLVLFSRK